MSKSGGNKYESFDTSESSNPKLIQIESQLFGKSSFRYRRQSESRENPRHRVHAPLARGRSVMNVARCQKKALHPIARFFPASIATLIPGRYRARQDVRPARLRQSHPVCLSTRCLPGQVRRKVDAPLLLREIKDTCAPRRGPYM